MYEAALMQDELCHKPDKRERNSNNPDHTFGGKEQRAKSKEQRAKSKERSDWRFALSA